MVGIPTYRSCVSDDDEESAKNEKHAAKTKEILNALHTDPWAAYKKYQTAVLDLPYTSHNNRDIVAELFDAIDTDGSNRVDVEEFKKFTRMLRSKCIGSDMEGGESSGRTSSVHNDEAVGRLFEIITSANKANDSVSKEELTNFLQKVLDSI